MHDGKLDWTVVLGIRFHKFVARAKPGKTGRSEAGVYMDGSTISSQRQQLAELGQKVRDARQEQKLSLRELARRTGLTPSLISQIERGITFPSVASLLSIAKVLGVPMEYFFASNHRTEENRGSYENAVQGQDRPISDAIWPMQQSVRGGLSPVVPLSEREVVRPARGVECQRLTPRHDQVIEFIELRYEVGASSSDLAQQHQGHEYGLVLQGKLLVELGVDKYVLEQGEGVSFDSSIPHRLTNYGDEAVACIWVIVDR